MSETKAQKLSVTDRVLNGIVNGIIEKRFLTGAKLPTEVELGKEFGAGRNSVREAVKMLEASGVVHIKRADGTYVSDRYDQKMLDPMVYQIILEQNSWEDFVELRAVIEIGMLHVILGQKEQMELSDLYDMLEQMKVEFENKAPSAEHLMRLDIEFHKAIAEKAKNPQLLTITDHITRLTIPSRLAAINKVISDNAGDTFLKLHQEVCDVMKDRRMELISDTVNAHYVFWK
ncbi:MAG: FadR/GntR family transcriptional regulator [Lachnospiraceae bacterium]